MRSNLEMLIKQSGMRPHKVALAANMNPSDLYSVISGNKKCFPGWRTRLAAALGVDEEDILIPWDPTPGQCEWTNEVKL